MSSLSHPARDQPAILLVAYGSLYPPSMATYSRIRERYESEFPGSLIRLAFTSAPIRRKMMERDGTSLPGPLRALAELQDLGHSSVVVQPLQIAPGGEFHAIASLVSGLKGIGGKFGFRSLEIGMPLLAGIEDCRMVSAALMPILERICNNEALEQSSKDSQEAVVLVGHGSSHPGESVYSLMAEMLNREHRNIFLGAMEGYPGIDEVIQKLNSSGVKEVALVPLLLVAGNHVLKDICGDGSSSWKSLIESRGFDVKICPSGLGENEEIISIFVDHTRRAMEKMTVEKRL